MTQATQPWSSPDEAREDLRRIIRQSGLFDAEAYLRERPVVAAMGLDPIDHYLDEGWKQGADPGPAFSTQHYLRANPDVREAEVNPLVHYLRDGRFEGREPLPANMLFRTALATRPPQAPSQAEWARIAESWRLPTAEPAVDVIVPVYRGFNETMRCLYSVLAAPQTTPYRLVVVNDHAPESELRDAVSQLADRRWIELFETPENLGFVGACNLGMRLHPERDVVLLNADAEVHNDWLDRMRAAAQHTPRAATVTPFSNNAEICSYPRFAQNNWRALEISDAELDRIAARINAGITEELPTGVGFCMYVRRACLDEIGLFNAASFGRGYGEENDLCRRAATSGWCNILAADVFVRHHGAVSFGASKPDRTSEALKTVERLHPGYVDLVGRFLREDPPRRARAALDMARLARRAGPKGAVLFVSHDRGGGIERHMQDLAALLESEGVAVLFCRVDPSDAMRLRIDDPLTPETPNLPSFDVTRHLERFTDALKRIRITHVHVHHFAGLSERSPDFIRLACGIAGIPYDVTLHDYMAICPRIFLIDRNGLYCGEPDPADCETCIGRDGSPFGRPSVWGWRDQYERLLTNARRVFVPDADVARRVRRYMPGISFHVRPHPEPHNDQASARPVGATQTPGRARASRRIAVIGAIGPHKGSSLLLDCARDARARRLPLEFIVMGYTDRDAELRKLANVSVTGKYPEDQALDRLAEIDADLAWFPALCPETYSYTLSVALAGRVFPVSFDFGAIASRIRQIGWGELMPLEWMLRPDRVGEHLAIIPLPPAPDIELFPACRYPDVLTSYYGVG